MQPKKTNSDVRTLIRHRDKEFSSSGTRDARRIFHRQDDAVHVKWRSLRENVVSPKAFGRNCWLLLGKGGAKAERLVRVGLQELGWREKELAERRKGDKGRVKLAGRLRAETTMILAWIAGRLRMGTWIYVSNLLHEKHGKTICVNSE